MVRRKRAPCIALIRTSHRRELLNTVSVFGDAKPKKEDIIITGMRVKEHDGGDFVSVQEDIQTQVQSQGGK